MTQDRLGASTGLRHGLRITLRERRDPGPVAGQRTRTPGAVGEGHTRAVLDLTIRLAEVMLSSGSGTADVVATAQDVAQAYRLTDCVVDITATTIIVSALPTAESPPVTIARSVRTRATDYTRLAEVDLLVQQIASGDVTAEQAHEAMDELTRRPHPYPLWMATAAWAGFAFGVAMMLGGTWLTCVLSALTAASVVRLTGLLNRLGFPAFFQHLSGAAIATLVAVAAYRFAGQGPTTLVATGIMVLLSGLVLVGALQDAVTGYMLTALSRIGEALFLTSGIVIGILTGLQIASHAGITIQLYVDATETFVIPHQPLPILFAVLGAGLAVASYAPPRMVPKAVVAAGLAELVLISLSTAGFDHVFAVGIAAVGVGLLATVTSIRRQAPALVTATAGIMPMLPGLAVFRAVFYFAADNNLGDAHTQLLAATTTAFALGCGVVLGELVGSAFQRRPGQILRPRTNHQTCPEPTLDRYSPATVALPTITIDRSELRTDRIPIGPRERQWQPPRAQEGSPWQAPPWRPGEVNGSGATDTN